MRAGPRHQPERDAARFLGGALSPAEREAFSEHLLGCADCWREVDEARRGRLLVESTRTAAPAALRDRVRGLVESETLEGSPERSGAFFPRRWLLAAGAVAAALIVAVPAAVTLRPGFPPPLRQAVADFSAQQLPGSQLPQQRAPDLSQLNLQPVGAGGGTYGGLEVDGYAYRDPAGRRVAVYLSDEAFPEAPNARRLSGEDGAWVAQRGDVVVLCARVPHALLVVGQDEQLVRSAAGALGVL